MNTQLVAAEVRLQQWAEVVRLRSGSGMSVEEYCSQNNITTGQYYYWLRKVREAAISRNAGRFVEIAAAEDAEKPGKGEKFTTQLTIQIGDDIIGVNEDTPGELLAKVIGVMKHA